MTAHATHAPAVVLLGPTASGKSAIAMRLADELSIEIISVDSAQVFRGMDVGTAKPTQAERDRVPHHLIDVVDPREAYSAARFAQDARQLVDEIRARGRLPLLVGGTMLYAKAFAEGLHDLPAADTAVRTRIEALAAQLGWPQMHRHLAEVDPDTAARLEPNDSQRIQRALEIHEITGQPMSALLAAHTRDAIGVPALRIALEPSDRKALHHRIELRLLAMIEQGLIDEVRRLRERPDLHANLPSMRCVGYRQAWEYLEGQYDRDTMIARAVAATRQLAKRQLTWLRSMPERRIVDCLAPDAYEQVRELILASFRPQEST